MKNSLRITLAMLFLVIAFRSFAQTPSYIYYVPLPEQQIHNAFSVVYSGTGTTYHTVVSIVPSENNILIYYDHWEDGYEANIGIRTQSSTLIWGDGNPANGYPPGYPADPPLVAGRAIVLENDITLPRNPSTILYDGRDKFAGTKSLAVTRSSWALNPGPVMADAIEFYNTKSFGNFFYFPIGQSTIAAGTDNSFSLVSLCVQASQNATEINVDKDGNGTTDVTAVINEGESYQVNGGIMHAGTVTTNKPVQIALLTGRIGATYSARWYNILPYNMWDRAYFTPVTTTVSTAISQVFIFNPEASAQTVTYETSSGLGTFSVPAKGVYRFSIPLNTSMHFHAPKKFYAVGGTDMDAGGNTTWDWGYSLVPELLLTNSIFVGWGPGCAGSPILYNGNPVWVGSTEDNDNTTIYVDLDGDPTTGASTDINGHKYDFTRVLTPYASTTIYDSDKDQTGMHVYTLDGKHIVAAWGEDALTAGAGNPFLDVGTTIPPDPDFVIGKAYKLTYDFNGNKLADVGDTITFVLKMNNFTLQPYTDIYLFDTIPSEVSYVANSTYYDLMPISDDLSPKTPFPIDQTGYFISLLPAGAKDSIYYKTVVNGPGITYSYILNKVTARDNFGNKYQSNVKVPANYNPTVCTIGFTNAGGSAVTYYNENSTIYIKVTDGDQNSNVMATDSVKVIVNSSTGDNETLYLLETGINTGIFTRSLPTSKVTGLGNNNGTLNAAAGSTIGVTYTDLIYGGTCSIGSFPISGPTFMKPLYLSDTTAIGTGAYLDRIKPPSTDVTAALTATLGGATTSPSVGVYTNTTEKYRTYTASAYGSEASMAGINNAEFYSEAKCPTRNEVLVAFQTNASGLYLRKWDGTAWTTPGSPLSDPVVASGGVTNAYRGEHIAYENVSGNAVFVWADNLQTAGNKLRFSVWNGTTWTIPASITATGNTSTPMYMQMASKPGSNEIMLVVAFNDASHSSYALIWNGSTWGNNLPCGTDANVDYTAIAAIYNGISKTGFVNFEENSAGVRSDYYTWNGTAWSAVTTIVNSSLGLASGYNKWVVTASNPNSDYIVAGFITTATSGLNVWFTVWNGSSWGSFTSASLGANNNRKGIAIATEMTSGRFIAAYSTAANNGTKYKIFTSPSTWSAETTGPTTGGAVPTVQQLYSKSSSNNIMWMASNASGNLYASEWNGTSFAAPSSLSTALTTPAKMPFSFWYGISTTGPTTTTFTQHDAMCSSITLPLGGIVKVKLWLSNMTGTIVSNPTISAILKNNGTAFLTLNSPTLYNQSGTANDTIVWTGAMASNYTITAGNTISLEITSTQGDFTFQISYDAFSVPSMVRLPASNVIDITELGVYNAAYSGGTSISTGYNGETVYVRAKVTDPFGYYDVHDVALRITDPSSGITDVAMSQVNVSGCVKTYEYTWVTGVNQGNYSLRVIASEGFEDNVKDTAQTSFNLQYLDTGTPCEVSFTDASGNPVIQYLANGTLYFKVKDLDKNTNISIAETVIISITSSTGDSESLTLTETGVNTGIFTGSLPGSTTGPVNNNNGTLYAINGSTIFFTYTDAVTSTDVCNANAYIFTAAPALSTLKTRLLPAGLYARIGDTVRWQITVTNPGNLAIADITMTDTYNNSCLTFLSASPAQSSTGSGTITWNTAAMGGALLVGQTRTFIVTFLSASGCGNINNSVTASSAANVLISTATSPVTLDNPQLSIVKTRTSPLNVPVFVGDNLTFSIVVTNTGSTTASTVPLVDVFSDYNFSYVSATIAPGMVGAGQINWSNIGPINVGNSVTISVTFTALHGNEGLNVINNASVDFGVDIHGNSIPSVNDSARLHIFNIPVAVNDINSTLVNTAINGTVMANDYDADGDILTATPFTSPTTHGNVILNANGTYTYTPNPGYTGIDTFIYTICDPTSKCASATVTITIIPCLDPPARPDNVH